MKARLISIPGFSELSQLELTWTCSWLAEFQIMDASRSLTISEISFVHFSQLSEIIFQGSMVPVLQCLNTLRVHLNSNVGTENFKNQLRKRWDPLGVGFSKEIDHSERYVLTSGQHPAENGEWHRGSVDAKSQCALHDPSGMLIIISIEGNKIYVHMT